MPPSAAKPPGSPRSSASSACCGARARPVAGRRRAPALGRELLRGLRNLREPLRAPADLLRARLPPAALAREAERDLPRRLRGLRQPARRHALRGTAEVLRILRCQPAAGATRALGRRLLECGHRLPGTGRNAPQRLCRAACRSTQVRQRRRRGPRARDCGGFRAPDSGLEVALPGGAPAVPVRLPAALRQRSVRGHRRQRADPPRRVPRARDLHDGNRGREPARARGRGRVRGPAPRRVAAAARRGGTRRLRARDDLVPPPPPLLRQLRLADASRSRTAAS